MEILVTYIQIPFFKRGFAFKTSWGPGDYFSPLWGTTATTVELPKPVSLPLPPSHHEFRLSSHPRVSICSKETLGFLLAFRSRSPFVIHLVVCVCELLARESVWVSEISLIPVNPAKTGTHVAVLYPDLWYDSWKNAF